MAVKKDENRIVRDFLAVAYHHKRPVRFFVHGREFDSMEVLRLDEFQVLVTPDYVEIFLFRLSEVEGLSVVPPEGELKPFIDAMFPMSKNTIRPL